MSSMMSAGKLSYLDGKNGARPVKIARKPHENGRLGAQMRRFLRIAEKSWIMSRNLFIKDFNLSGIHEKRDILPAMRNCKANCYMPRRIPFSDAVPF
jgi:hypothetical protein